MHGDAPKNPARFSEPILDVMAALIERFSPACDGGVLLDPFAGVGGYTRFARTGRTLVGVEIEPEWAAQCPTTICGSALAVPLRNGSVDTLAFSPTYGNRMADHHDARDDSKRHTYRHYLGRPLNVGNTGAMQWGLQYRLFHWAVYDHLLRYVLRPGGLVLLNVSDHYRKGVRQPVSAWHRDVFLNRGCLLLAHEKVSTRRQKHGANGSLRVEHEDVFAMVYEPVMLGARWASDAGDHS